MAASSDKPSRVGNRQLFFNDCSLNFAALKVINFAIVLDARLRIKEKPQSPALSSSRKKKENNFRILATTQQLYQLQ